MNNETECRMVCDQNETEVVRLHFLTAELAHWVTEYAEEYEKFTSGRVQVDFVEVDTLPTLSQDIINEATSQTGLYDGFVTPPAVAGSVVEQHGWADLTPFIEETTERTADWADILVGYRQWIAQYKEEIIMYPLDGDMLHLFYRKDILEKLNLPVPRTWDEYNQVAAATHGITFENKTMTGSCVGRLMDCVGSYWANLLLSSITQTEGTWSGHLFDTKNMKPLTGPAMEQALLWMEEQVKYGPTAEFDKCFDLNIDNSFVRRDVPTTFTTL